MLKARINNDGPVKIYPYIYVMHYEESLTWLQTRHIWYEELFSVRRPLVSPRSSGGDIHAWQHCYFLGKRWRIQRRLDWISWAVLPAPWHLLATLWIPAVKLTIFRPELDRNYSTIRIFNLASFKCEATQGIIIMTASVIENDIFPVTAGEKCSKVQEENSVQCLKEVENDCAPKLWLFFWSWVLGI
jgi:hypothetical protein